MNFTSFDFDKSTIKDKDIMWESYLSRPFDLFCSSVWNTWYAGEPIKNVTGINSIEGLFVEYPKGVSNHFREIGFLNILKRHIANMVINDPDKAIKILERGVSMNAEARNFINNKEEFDIDKALSFLAELAIHATIFPLFAADELDDKNSNHQRVLALCTELRGQSLYPDFISEVLVPAVKKYLAAYDINENDYSFLTIQEIFSHDFAQIDERKQKAVEGRYYIYEYKGGVEKVVYIESSDNVISQITQSNFKDIVGRPTFPGKVMGTVRKVFFNDINIPFEQGDILVAISTNPNITPFDAKSRGDNYR